MTIPPPTTAETRFYDQVWAGRPHRNICVKMTKGEAKVVLDRGERSGIFVPYGAYFISAIAGIDQPAGLLRIALPDHSDYTGRFCLGLAKARGK